MLSGALPLLATVTVCAALVAPLRVEGKVNDGALAKGSSPIESALMSTTKRLPVASKVTPEAVGPLTIVLTVELASTTPPLATICFTAWFPESATNTFPFTSNATEIGRLNPLPIGITLELELTVPLVALPVPATISFTASPK